MRILITNDDSVSASQLLPLIRWCQKLGEVTTVVPAIEQSGKSHGIEIHNAFGFRQVQLAPDVTVTAVDSTPADCVRFAVFGLKQEYDLVISGINRGFNIGADVMYSGTVAAVIEAAILGLPAIALSTCPEYYDHAIDHLDRVFDFIQHNKLLDRHGIFNINIPPQPKSIRFTCQGGPYYSDDFALSNGICTPVGKCVYKDTGDLSVDTNAVMNGYISIMPLTVNMTAMDAFDLLSPLNEI